MKGLIKVETPNGFLISNVPIHLFLLDKWVTEGGRTSDFLRMVRDKTLKVYIDNELVEHPIYMDGKNIEEDHI